MNFYMESALNYDKNRGASSEVVSYITSVLSKYESVRLLDMGCGTGNYINALSEQMTGEYCGIDKSQSMLVKAKKKCSKARFVKTSIENPDIGERQFNVILMTNVIHQLSSPQNTFNTARTLLKPRGDFFLLTLSHEQIKNRPIMKFFPNALELQSSRFPTIELLRKSSEISGFKLIRTVVVEDEKKIRIDDEYLQAVRDKSYSFLHLLDEREYEMGIKAIESQVKLSENSLVRWSGQTLMHFRKD